MATSPLILIVDDEPQFLEIYRAKLEAAGFRVETAMSGEDGYAAARKVMPNLILMDVQMPGIGGVEALIKIKEDEKTSSIPVLFLTALGDPRAEIQEINRRLSKEMGAVGYLKKTDDADVVVDYVKNFLS